MRKVIAQLDVDPCSAFPPADRALTHPNGLLAFGGDLHLSRLLNAYAHGIFPWYSDGQPILWWSPDPRMVVVPGRLHCSRSLKRFLRRCDWQVTLNQAFDRVIGLCADLPRLGQRGTWITDDMRVAYVRLHNEGHAHSIEVWAGDQLVGGIYGVAIGRMFFGESMFSLAPNASKVAIAALCRALALSGFVLLDGQVESDHLRSLGFAEMARAEFLDVCARHSVGDSRWETSELDVSVLQPVKLAAARASDEESELSAPPRDPPQG